jgi:hypothetical protein
MGMSDEDRPAPPIPQYFVPPHNLEQWTRIHDNARADRADAVFHLVRLVPVELQPEAMLWVLEMEHSATNVQGQLEALWSRTTQSAYLEGRATMAQETTREMMGQGSEAAEARGKTH